MERDAVAPAVLFHPCDFNSHAHVERDKFAELSASTTGISTHTLTWSVTQVSLRMPKGKRDFNSHAHVERDIHEAVFRSNGTISTHTLTWSVTHDAMCYNIITVISTHTLTWSVTS